MGHNVKYLSRLAGIKFEIFYFNKQIFDYYVMNLLS